MHIPTSIPSLSQQKPNFPRNKSKSQFPAMVVLSQPILDSLSNQFKTCKPVASDTLAEIPVIDLSSPNSKTDIVAACSELGFFKVVNHGVSMESLNLLESEVVKFFELPQTHKDRSGPPNPFGYGNKRIGSNGDTGWVEYLLFCTNPELISHSPAATLPEIPQTLRRLVYEYVGVVRRLVCEVLEMIADELRIEPRDALSRLIRDHTSDSCFRLNHYPPCTDHQALLSGRDVVGFGEHTDPQLMSVVRSNTTSGLQICLRDGSWLPVPSDPTSFYLNVGDSLQVMTNGRFRSVKHRVMAGGLKSRVSMIYFGGPPLSEKIRPLTSLMADGEDSLYEEFTWSEYKKSAYNTRLGDDRLALFQKSKSNPSY
ncbi:gibberellin 2-beta-dioxygenase-like [Andrographis paniculata]|uniref:gibberellin 2-beta-dioxygenase-like n=1 Tax=Andrographis paniculata TaxID=175694 RepID=UPI0021E81410|nr:gibberellin 2-beta-dioxygenase-like [Andrographis paniculata]